MAGYEQPPGPMGWGLEQDSEDQKIRAERTTREAIAKVAPNLMQYAPKEPKNQALIDEVKAAVKAAGWDDGFSFRFLFQIVMAKYPGWLAQLIGSCVASGDFRTTVYRQLAEVFILNDPEELAGFELSGPESIAFFAPFSYRAGRREAGINGNSDGSLCLPHIRGKMKFGHLPCNTPGLRSDAFPEPQSERLYREWGANNRLMDQYLEQAGKFKLLDSPEVTSHQQSVDLIEELVPQNICSSQGFRSTGKKLGNGPDGKGIYQWRPGGTWHHNMSRVGWFELNGRRFTEIENSWAGYHDGNESFVVEADDDERWIQRAEVQGVGNIDLKDNGPAINWT